LARRAQNEAPVERKLPSAQPNYGVIDNNSERYVEDLGPLFCF
jgi:hypothetical protein